jgi:hypothetical protein
MTNAGWGSIRAASSANSYVSKNAFRSDLFEEYQGNAPRRWIVESRIVVSNAVFLWNPLVIFEERTDAKSLLPTVAV